MRMRILTPLLAIALVALALTGCSPGVPDSDPSMSGQIVGVLPGDQLGSIAVEAPKAADVEYDRAVVAITSDTTLFVETGAAGTEEIAFEDLAVGDEVDVWFEGPVAESYPVQAT